MIDSFVLTSRRAMKSKAGTPPPNSPLISKPTKLEIELLLLMLMPTTTLLELKRHSATTKWTSLKWGSLALVTIRVIAAVESSP